MKRPKKLKIELTPKQAQLIRWALAAGLDQFEKHLLHDDWDSGKDQAAKAKTLGYWRDFKKALSLFSEKTDDEV